MSQESQEKPGGNTNTPGSRNQLYRWFLTIPYEEITASQLSQHLLTFCKKFTFQAEEGKSGYKHWQCEISLKSKEYFQSVKNLIGIDKAHIEPTKDYFSAKNYCSKEETRIEGPYDETSTFLKIITELRIWQQQIINIIKNEPDDRTINWFWEKKGLAGKTQLCKYLIVHHKAQCIGSCKSADMAYAINNPKIVVINLTRTSEEHVNYGALEAIKDGLIFSSKYESGVKIFNSPHIFVFANYPPDTSTMSEDRWNIVDISIPLSIKDSLNCTNNI
jgi:hypothetical protein